MIPKLQSREDPTSGPLLDPSLPCTVGWRNIIVEKGPEAFAKAVREYPGVLIMDTTWRDAHQSLLATRLRTIDMVNIAKETSFALANAYSLECWGGATFDVAMRFLYEDPWERLVCLELFKWWRVIECCAAAHASQISPEHPLPSSCPWCQWCWIHQLSVGDPLKFVPPAIVDTRSRDNAIYDFSKKAVENGLDIFRVFDSLNYFGKW